MKRCNKCKEQKSIDSFRAKRGSCRACEAKGFREFRKLHPGYDKKQRDYFKLARLDVLFHYGGNPPKCACCGEKEIHFLAIDHINNDGGKHRREDKQARKNISIWIKKNNFPPIFQILCHNCNLAKGFYGQCPHKI